MLKWLNDWRLRRRLCRVPGGTVSRIQVGPRDVMVISVRDRLPAAARHHLAEALKSGIGVGKVVILEEGMKLSAVLSPSQSGEESVKVVSEIIDCLKRLDKKDPTALA